MRRRKTRQTLPLIVAVLTFAGLTVGCAPTANSDDDNDDTGSATSEVQSAEATEPLAEPKPLTGAACLTGTWKMELETFEASLEKLVAGSGELPAEMLADIDFTLAGGNYIRFDGGDVYTAWLEDYTMTMSAMGSESVHHQNSAETATYGVEGDISWIANPVSLYFEATLTAPGGVVVAINESDAAQVSVFGLNFTVPGVDRELIDGAARFECEEDSLRLYGDYDTTASYTRAPEGVSPR